MKSTVSKLLIIVLFFLMLSFPEQVFAGACKGLLLWFDRVLPTLFPFMVISGLLIETKAADWIAKLTGPILCRVFDVSVPGSFAVVTGFLCGYPMGSKVTADLLRAEKISFREASYLLSFCNNASPAFIVSYLVMQNLDDDSFLFPALAILLLSPVLASFLFRILQGKPCPNVRKSKAVSPEKQKSTRKLPSTEGNDTDNQSSSSLLDSCLTDSMDAIVKIGGYMMLFSILITLCSLLPLSNPLFRSIFLPSLEMTNGIRIICQSSLTPTARFFFSLVCTSFGGWCAVAQTACVTEGTGLSMRSYAAKKLVTAGITSLLAFVYLCFF